MREEPKFKRGQKVYCLFLSDETTGRKDNNGNNIECRELIVTKPFYNKEYRRWAYHIAHFASVFFEHELSENPL